MTLVQELSDAVYEISKRVIAGVLIESTALTVANIRMAQYGKTSREARWSPGWAMAFTCYPLTIYYICPDILDRFSELRSKKERAADEW